MGKGEKKTIVAFSKEFVNGQPRETEVAPQVSEYLEKGTGVRKKVEE